MAKSTGESEYHAVALRLRCTGSGTLKLTLSDLDHVQNQSLIPITLQATTRIEPTRLANFQSQRISFGISTVNIDETFIIRRVIVFVKPVAVEYPM